MTDKRTIPIFATIVVVAAIATMVALGIWQYQRAGEKDRLLALYERNIAMAEPVAFPETGPMPDDYLFRRSSIVCLDVVGIHAEGGRSPKGGATNRYIADCRTSAEGPGAKVQIGTSEDPALSPDWSGDGDIVSGWISTAPDYRSLLGRLMGGVDPGPMLVATPPLAGLEPNATPSLEDIPNNHIAYMWQWFFFAAMAAVIYGIALRQRMARKAEPDDA